MAETRTYDLIIAGGGFVGMSLALALGGAAPKGFRVALVDAEPAESTKPDARASALSAASKGLLSVLGIWPALAGNAEAIATIEITDSSLDAKRRPHLLGFDDDLKPGESGAYYDRERGSHPRAQRALFPARRPSRCSRPTASPPSRRRHLPLKRSLRAAAGSGPSFSSPPTASARACASALASNASAGAIRKLGIVTTVAHAKPHHGKAVQHFLPGRPLCHAAAQRQSLLHRMDRRQGDGRGDHGGRRSRRSSPSSPSASARGSAISRLPARANPSRSIFRSRGAS